MLSLLPLVISATAAAPATASPAYALLDSPVRHVRTTNRAAAGLLRLGATRSPTFAALLSHLNASDVIVYIEPVQWLPPTLAGRLLLTRGSRHQRYLRIQITMNATRDELVAIIGHELRHAVEVADAPDVRNDADLVRLYRRIGTPSIGDRCYETQAALSTARLVLKELLA